MWDMMYQEDIGIRISYRMMRKGIRDSPGSPDGIEEMGLQGGTMWPTDTQSNCSGFGPGDHLGGHGIVGQPQMGAVLQGPV